MRILPVLEYWLFDLCSVILMRFYVRELRWVLIRALKTWQAELPTFKV